MGQPTQKAKVVNVHDLCPSVRQITLLPLEWKMEFQAGQWISVRVPIGDRPLVRAYSMAEPESVTGRLLLVLDRVPEGVGSGHLFSLVEGDELVISGPYGNFTAPKPLLQDLVFIARFTGIVPVRCILRSLFTQPVQGKVLLIYGAPSAEKQLYHEEFLSLAKSNQGFQYLPSMLTDPEDASTGSELEILTSLSRGRTDFFPMLSGVKAFVGPIKIYLSALGFMRKQMKVETYD
jgi:ferredoxin-NADP reductase